jgi:hypothetical protein
MTGFTTKGRKLIITKGRVSHRAKKWLKRAGGPYLARACFGQLARFGHFVFTGSQMVEEIWVKFHPITRTNKGLQGSVFFKKNHKFC